MTRAARLADNPAGESPANRAQSPFWLSTPLIWPPGGPENAFFPVRRIRKMQVLTASHRGARMSGFGGNGQLSRFLRLLGVGAGCLTLANCANGNMSSRVDPNSIATAEARHGHQRIIRNADRAAIQYVNNADPIGAIVGRRPADCPHSYCGCEASRYLFGHVRPDLNLASNWAWKFPRTAPAPGMAAVRNHHVFVLMSYVGGSNWLVHDGNSGHGLTREHVRSIGGYTVVNPQTRLTEAMATTN